MPSLTEAVDTLAHRTGFSGVVRVESDGASSSRRPTDSPIARTGSPTRSTRSSAIASGTKGLTALAVMSLIEDGTLELDDDRAFGPRRRPSADRRRRDGRAPAGAPVGHRRLPRRGRRRRDHRLRDAGAGARARDDRAVPRGARRPPDRVPAGRAVRLLQRRLRRARADRRAGERRAVPRARARARVRARRAWRDTAFLRSDELPGRAALGYLDVDDAPRTNVFHLPVRGSGDGGIYSTAADISCACGARSSPAGSCRSGGWPRWCGRAATCRQESMRYGLGFWLHASSDVVMLEGYDAGVSFRSGHDPASATTHTVHLEHDRGSVAHHDAPRRRTGVGSGENGEGRPGLTGRAALVPSASS